MTVAPLRERPAWKALERHHGEISGRHLRELFAEDPGRGERLGLEAVGIYLDYSKNRITDETLRLLLQLAEESDLAGHRDAMFRGDHINVSEDRAVLHVALRMPRGTSLVVDGVDVVKEVNDVLDAMSSFCERVRSGEWKWSHRQADPQHRQYRDRRIRPRSCDGLRGTAPLHPSRSDDAVRVQCRLDRLCGGDTRPVCGRDALHHLLEDLYHSRDAHQRHLGEGLGGGPAR